MARWSTGWNRSAMRIMARRNDSIVPQPVVNPAGYRVQLSGDRGACPDRA